MFDHLDLPPFVTHPLTIKIGILILTFVIIRMIIGYLKKVANKTVKETTQKYKYRKMLNFISYLAFIIAITIVFSEKMRSVGVFLGVAGAGIAFALQEVIVSIAGWFAINFNHFFKIGDRVKLGGIKGDVIDIGILRTTIMEIGEWVDGDLYNGRTVRVSNSFVFKEPVFNYSDEFPFLWDEIKIPVKLQSNRSQVQTILKSAADAVVGAYVPTAEKRWNKMENRFMVEDAQTAPMITMVADENWMTYTLRYVVDYKSRRGVKDELFNLIVPQILDSSDVFWASAAQEVTIMH